MIGLISRVNRSDIEAELCRRSLRRFGQVAWSIVEPSTPYLDNWHNGIIAEHLEACARGEIQNLVINQPPGTAKSLWSSVFFPAWWWTWRPGARGLFVSYDRELSTRDSMRTQKVIESLWYKSQFSGPAGWTLDPRQHEKTYYWNTRTGFRQSDSFGGSTGWRVNGIVADDPLSVKESWSKPKRTRVNQIWDQALHNRVADPQRDFRIVVMQRLHSRDLSGHLLARGDFQHLCLPSEYDPKRSFVTVNREGRIFREDPRTKPGEVLFPQLQPVEYLAAERVRLGSTGYANQHDQSPNVEGGGLFKRTWWRFWKRDGVGGPGVRARGCYEGAAEPLPDTFDLIGVFVDAAFKDGDENDYVVITVVGFKGARRYVLERFRRRADFSATIGHLTPLVDRWRKDPRPGRRASRIVIEDKANGPAIVSAISRAVPGVIAWNPGQDSKEARAQFVSPLVEAGNWVLPDDAPWLDEWIDEFDQFPNGDHDDQVDTVSMAELSTGVNLGASRLRALGTL